MKNQKIIFISYIKLKLIFSYRFLAILLELLFLNRKDFFYINKRFLTVTSLKKLLYSFLKRKCIVKIVNTVN